MTDTEGVRHTGTVLWRDLVHYRGFGSPTSDEPPRQWSVWEYAVELPDIDRCPTLPEERLESTGQFDSEEAHRGRRHEISFDTGLEDDNPIVEGCYRVPGEFWQVFLIESDDDIPAMCHKAVTWQSGITGISFRVPAEDVVDRDYIFRAFATAFGTDDWTEVRGPDSLLLK